MKERRVWTRRFTKLREMGLNDEQLIEVFRILSEARAFKFAWLEYSAERQLCAILNSESITNSLDKKKMRVEW